MPLVVREWPDGNVRSPLLCLPGIVRTSGDFEALAHAIGEGRRVVAPDYAGRGLSGRSRDVSRYAPEACLRDMLDICAALHLHQVLRSAPVSADCSAWVWRPLRPSLLRGVVLNDVGPDIGSDGAEFVRRFIGNDTHSPISTPRSRICGRCCRRCRLT